MKKIIFSTFFIIFISSCAVDSNKEELESTKLINELATSKFLQLEQNFQYTLLKRFSKKYRPIPIFKTLTDSILDYTITTKNMDIQAVELCESSFSECWDNLYIDGSITKPKKLEGVNFNEFINSIKLYQFLIADKALYECNKQQFHMDEYQVVVVRNKEKLKSNEEFFSKIYLTGRNVSCDPEIYIKPKGENSEFLPIPITEGVGDFNVAPSAKGDYEWEGKYVFKNIDNSQQIELPFKINYKVE